MAHKNNDKINTQIVTMNSGRKWHISHSVLTLVIALLLLIAVGGAYIAYQKWFNHSKITTTVQSTKEKAAAQKFAQIDSNRQRDLVAKLAAAKTPEEKSAIYIKLANVSSGQGNMQQSLMYAKQAVDASKSIDSYAALGFRAEQVKDYKLAAEMYGNAANLVKSSNLPEKDYEYDSYISLKQHAESQIK